MFNKPLNFLSLFLHLRLAKPTVSICFYGLPVSSSELGEPNTAGTGDEFGTRLALKSQHEMTVQWRTVFWNFMSFPVFSSYQALCYSVS